MILIQVTSSSLDKSASAPARDFVNKVLLIMTSGIRDKITVIANKPVNKRTNMEGGERDDTHLH